MTHMAMGSSKEKPGGKENMAIDGTERGERGTMDPDGFTSMERVAVGSIGTPMSSRKLGTSVIPTTALSCVSKTLFSSERSAYHLKQLEFLE